MRAALTVLVLAGLVVGCADRGLTSGGAAPSSPVESAATPTPTQSTTGASVAPTSAPPSTAAPREAGGLACVRALPLRARVGQLLMPTVRGSDLQMAAGQWRALGIGGALIRDAESDPTGAGLRAFKEASPIPVLVAADEEGGRAQTLDVLGPLPAAADVPHEMTPEAARQLVTDHAGRVRDYGVDVAFAPVVDVAPLGATGPLGDRVFSDDPDVVTAYGGAYVDAWEAAGILPVLKHFPGHGAATADTHRATARTAPLATLEQRDLLPYKALASTSAGVMVGHLIVPGLTDSEPASVSRAAITDVLRGRLGFADALVFSDSLDMAALTSAIPSLASAVVATIQAGADVAVFTAADDAPAAIDALAEAVRSGDLGEDQVDASVARVLAAKHVDPCSIEVS